jgi:uncharacterized membrane protein
LCNRSSYILYAASVAITGPQSEARGWTRVVPGDCQEARREPLTARNYLIYARSGLSYSGPARAWGGNFPVCVKDTDFVSRQAAMQPYCPGDDMFALPFAALDTKAKPNWTMNFDEAPAYPSLLAAQLAGVKRLLSDIGYPVGAIDGTPDRKTGVALAAFRKRMRFSSQATNADLFNALEAQALATAVPAGYTICNDTGQLLLVALAQLAQGKATAHGWWKIPAHACAKAITAPLAADAIYLLAQTRNGATRVGGTEPFCIAGVAFDIQDRGHCPARGFAQAGFAKTVTQGLAGYVAHIGERGLIPLLAPRHAAILK